MASWGGCPPEYSHFGYSANNPDHGSPPPSRYDHVSTYEHLRSKARSHSMASNLGNGNGNPKRRASMRSQTQPIIIDDVDEARYVYIRPRPTGTHFYQRRSKADPHFSSTQVRDDDEFDEPVRRESQAERPRTRRASQPTTERPRSSPTKKATPAKTHREATEEDRIRHGIKAGYSTKNWDPTEKPILLLGSVFDANSMGKYIYDWTVAHYKAGTPMSEVAGDLWLLLIRLAGKMKRAEAGVPRIRSKSKRIMVQDFINRGQKHWATLTRLLKDCEEYMWIDATEDAKTGAKTMSKNAGSELVKGLFGRDRRLEKTEKLMQRLRNWILDFEADAEDVLR